MKIHQEAAIAAIATAPVSGAVGIIRVSGEGAVKIAEKVFFALDGKPLSAHAPRSLVFGEIKNEAGERIDRCLGVYFPAPYSYTGEDVAELHCHGGMALLSMVLSLVLQNGAAMAQPGEYTRRAFLNGKLDLTQAEAVADLIDADFSGAVKNAAGQLSGVFGEKIRGLYEALRGLAASLSASLDYSDQNVEAPKTDTRELLRLSAELKTLAATAAAGRMLKDGVRCALIGRPNGGKSSLFNRILGYDRSIVTSEAGTTRDVVTEKVPFGGVPLLLCDTAGIRKTESLSESAGVKLSRSEAERAGLVLALFDVSSPLTAEDEEIMGICGQKEICIANKTDLGLCKETEEALAKRYGRAVYLSCATGEGMKELEKAVGEAAGLSSLRPDGSLVTNARQADGLARASALLSEAAEAATLGAEDALWGLVQESARELGKILGIEADADVEKEIFSRFCIGK